MVLTRILLVPALFLFSRLESSCMRVHLCALNIRDYPSDNLRTCLKMTVWWLFIEQKNIRKKFVFRKNIFRGFSTTLMELWAKESKSSIFVKNHLFLINSRGKSSKNIFSEEKYFPNIFLFYKQSSYGHFKTGPKVIQWVVSDIKSAQVHTGLFRGCQNH